MRLPLLPLVGLVAFPGAPPYLLSADAVTDGTTIGLVHSRGDGRLADVGTLATARSLSSDVPSVLTCEASSRFRIIDAESGLVEPLEDAPPPDDDAAAEMDEACETLRRRLGELSELRARVEGGEATPPVVPPPSAGPAAFSLALAGVVEHESLASAQALLESTSTARRLRALDEALAEAVQYTATQAMLARLGGMGG